VIARVPAAVPYGTEYLPGRGGLGFSEDQVGSDEAEQRRAAAGSRVDVGDEMRTRRSAIK